MRRLWRRWSPWRLREALRTQRDWLRDERAHATTDRDNTYIEQCYRHVALALAGHPDPTAEATRYRVKGQTLLIDATEHGAMYSEVKRGEA